MRMMIDQFLDLTQFNLNVNEEDYQKMLSKVKNVIAQKFASKGQIVILESSIRKHHHTNSRHQSSSRAALNFSTSGNQGDISSNNSSDDSGSRVPHH